MQNLTSLEIEKWGNSLARYACNIENIEMWQDDVLMFVPQVILLDKNNL